MCHDHDGPCTCPTPCAWCRDHPYIMCGVCALWIPSREDSTASGMDMGICPRREWPHNRTSALDGCRDGVIAME